MKKAKIEDSRAMLNKTKEERLAYEKLNQGLNEHIMKFQDLKASSKVRVEANIRLKRKSLLKLTRKHKSKERRKNTMMRNF